MTGPQHYAEAERLIAESNTTDREYAALAIAIARAQGHATLAHDTTPHIGSTLNADDWTDVLDTNNP